MKRFLCVLLALAMSVGLFGCNSKDKETITMLENEVVELKTELEFLKNGEKNLIQQIRTLYEQKKYDEVLSVYKTLHEKFNGTPEDAEGYEYVSKINAEREVEKQKQVEEEQRKAAEAAKSKQDKLREIIRVKKVTTSTPNSAGGVDVDVEWINNSEKVIKYVVFVIEPYNAVNDVVSCKTRRKSESRVKETGPITKGNGNKKGTSWENAWYNYSIKYAKLKGIEIEYMDGSEENITGEDMNFVIY